MNQEYEAFFREGGYRLMKLLVLKAEAEPDYKAGGFNVISLMQLQRCCGASDDWLREKEAREFNKSREIQRLNCAMERVLGKLPWRWGEVVDLYFGRGEKIKSNGVRIRKQAAERALAGACAALEEYTGDWYHEQYDFSTEGLHAMRKIMSCFAQASAAGENEPDSWLMRAVASMKLFRNSRQGIIYLDALEEFCDRSGIGVPQGSGVYDMEVNWEDAIAFHALAEQMMIREETWDGQQRTRLESKLNEKRSSELIDRMYDVYAIMYAIKKYLPEKYEKIMSFHWTRNNEKLTNLFLEMAAMLAASEDGSETSNQMIGCEL